jgi:methyltransferase (TIGR00027 family)
MSEPASGNRVRAGEPSRTAFGVALLRAAHQLLDEPIVLDDPIALSIVGPEAEAALRADPFVYNEPMSRALRAALVVRSRFAEDELARAVAAGVRQYVVLGAGLDTFAYRNPDTALQVYEVDHPSTQQWKRQLLRQAAIPLPANLTFASVDFERCSIAQGLQEAGFRADCPACFSWLGVTMYLTEAAIMKTLSYVATLPGGSTISFDFRAPPSANNPIERAVAEVMAERLAAIGEPWISAFDPAAVCGQVAALGFDDVTAYEPDELNRRYLYRRKDGLRTGGRLLCARKGTPDLHRARP